MTRTLDNWRETNQRDLNVRLERLRLFVATRTGGEVSERSLPPATEREEGSAPYALEAVSMAFQLSPFERDLLLLCAGMELDATFASTVAQALAPSGSRPTFGFALGVLEDPHWSATTPVAPLRRWRLIEFEERGALASRPLRIAERVLHFLAGLSYLDERLRGSVVRAETPRQLPPSRIRLADSITKSWERVRDSQSGDETVQLCGKEGSGRLQIAAAACARMGIPLYIANTRDVPRNPEERAELARLWEREARLSGAVLFLAANTTAPDDETAALVSFLAELEAPCVVATDRALRLRSSASRLIDVPNLDSGEQRELWEVALREANVADLPSLNGSLDRLVSQFELGPDAIRSSCVSVQESGASTDAHGLEGALWNACRTHARPALDGLALRIDPVATWEDLVLPADQIGTLRDIAVHVRQRATVYGDWGFGAKGERGLGLCALFTGASGTGKTMAAEVLANELNLDLYRIDLSQVVNKYIGETEKNLRRVFDAAEAGGCILLFDEADAVFGKRSEVKDSHDRHANIEVSYLLQRTEAYRGLAILTTNMRNALDTAFLRRIRFVVPFPFPDVAGRRAIWRGVFPKNAPIEGLDFDKLARLNVSGGHIRNIGMHAAFLAAEEDSSIRMSHLQRAVEGEYAKLERVPTDAEIGGWA